MRGLAERALAPVDEGGAHAVGLGADAVEGVVGDEQDAGAVQADDLRGLGVGLPVRLEVAGLLRPRSRDRRESRCAGRRPSSMSRIAVGEDGELVAGAAQLFERRRPHRGTASASRSRATSQRTSSWRVGDAAAVHDVGDRAMADLAIGRVPAVAQRVDHRVLEVRAPPPGDEAVRASRPSPSCLRNGVTASVSPFCMSTMVPYWSKASALISRLRTSGCSMGA